MYIATAKNHVAALELLIKANADVNMALQDGTTPLLIAAQNDHVEAFELLLKAGANVSTTAQVYARTCLLPCQRTPAALAPLLLFTLLSPRNAAL